MPSPTHRFASLDTSFLLALAAGDQDCEEVLDWLGRNNVYALVTPTVVQELVDLEEQDKDAGPTAKIAKTTLGVWGILAPSIEPTEHGIATIIARKFVEKGVLPDECENDGLVLAEAGIEGCRMLITYRKSILDAPKQHLKLVLLESDVADLLAASPDQIVAYLHKQKATPASST